MLNFILGRKHKYRNRASAFTQTPAHLESIHLRHHHIEYNHIRITVQYSAQAIGSVRSCLYVIALKSKTPAQHGNNFFIIINN
ncbi:hypothetical protein D3C79_877580 [compost metagenome]